MTLFFNILFFPNKQNVVRALLYVFLFIFIFVEHYYYRKKNKLGVRFLVYFTKIPWYFFPKSTLALLLKARNMELILI